METDSSQTPDVDLPGQHRPPADLDIDVEPESEDPAAQGAAAGGADEPEGAAASDDPELGNTLIRPENS